MIIDRILDRKDFGDYNAHDFYFECLGYNKIFPHVADDITIAMDYGTNEDVQKSLCDYVSKNGYNLKICDYIKSVNWI